MITQQKLNDQFVSQFFLSFEQSHTVASTSFLHSVMLGFFGFIVIYAKSYREVWENCIFIETSVNKMLYLFVRTLFLPEVFKGI